MQTMRSGATFSLSWYTANLRERTGGKLKSVKKATLLGAVERGKQAAANPFLPDNQPRPAAAPKPPSHRKNDTINIEDADSKLKYKVHVRLIEKFNNQRVVW